MEKALAMQKAIMTRSTVIYNLRWGFGFAEYPRFEIEGHSAQATAEVLWSLQNFGTLWDSSIPTQTPWHVENPFRVSCIAAQAVKREPRATSSWRCGAWRRRPTRILQGGKDSTVALSFKTRRRRREFLVLWQGYPAEEAEWIPTSFFWWPGCTTCWHSRWTKFQKNRDQSSVSEDRNSS